MASTTAQSTGNWNDASKWSNGVPTINDDATINSGVTMTGNVAMSCKTLNITGTLDCNSQNLTVASGTKIANGGDLDGTGSTISMGQSIGTNQAGDGTDGLGGWGLYMGGSTAFFRGFYADSITISSVAANFDGSNKCQFTSGSKTLINGYNAKSQNGTVGKWMIKVYDGFSDIVTSSSPNLAAGRVELRPPTGDTDYLIKNYDSKPSSDCIGELTISGAVNGAVVNIIGDIADNAAYDDFCIKNGVFISGTTTLKATRPWGSQTHTGYLREIDFGTVYVGKNATLDMSDLGPQDDAYGPTSHGGIAFDSIVIGPTGSYKASSGTTVIRGKTAYDGNPYAYRDFSSSTLIQANGGTHYFTAENFDSAAGHGNGTQTRVEQHYNGGKLHNITVSTSAANTGEFRWPYWSGGGNPGITGDFYIISGVASMQASRGTVDGNMVIMPKGEYNNNDTSASRWASVTVSGAVICSGTWDMSYYTSGQTIGSLWVGPAATCILTSGTTTLLPTTAARQATPNSRHWYTRGAGTVTIPSGSTLDSLGSFQFEFDNSDYYHNVYCSGNTLSKNTHLHVNNDFKSESWGPNGYYGYNFTVGRNFHKVGTGAFNSIDTGYYAGVGNRTKWIVSGNSYIHGGKIDIHGWSTNSPPYMRSSGSEGILWENHGNVIIKDGARIL